MSDRDTTEFDDANIKVITSKAEAAEVRAVERSPFLARRDSDLAEIETMLRQARDLVDEALTGFTMYEPHPQHRSVSLEIGQLIEQVIEFKRTKG